MQEGLLINNIFYVPPWGIFVRTYIAFDKFILKFRDFKKCHTVET